MVFMFFWKTKLDFWRFFFIFHFSKNQKTWFLEKSKKRQKFNFVHPKRSNFVKIYWFTPFVSFFSKGMRQRPIAISVWRSWHEKVQERDTNITFVTIFSSLRAWKREILMKIGFWGNQNWKNCTSRKLCFLFFTHDFLESPMVPMTQNMSLRPIFGMPRWKISIVRSDFYIFEDPNF